MKGVEPGALRMKSKTKTSAGKLGAEQTWRPRQPKRCRKISNNSDISFIWAKSFSPIQVGACRHLSCDPAAQLSAPAAALHHAQQENR